MTKDEALDLALEALEYIHEGANNQRPHTGISWRCVAVKAEPAITAIKQARALDKMADNARELGLDYEPAPVQQEWIETACALIKAADDAAHDSDYMLDSNDCIKVLRGQWNGPLMNDKPAAPQPAQQEPVGEVSGHDWSTGILYQDLEPGAPLYTSPPAQRTWVGLTLSDREKLRDQFEGWSYPAILVDAVSDILKEKNT